MWEHSSAGRASALQAEGHRFEPCCSHHTNGPVVQLVRTLACHARGRGFESHPGRHPCFASVAQLVEQGTENPRVVGSIPTGGYIEMTIDALRQFGCSISFSGNRISVAKTAPLISPEKVSAGGDWSNSAFFLSAGLIGKKTITLTGLYADSVQGDKKIVDILREFGGRIEIGEKGITAYPSSLRGITLDARDIPDLVPVLSVVAANAEGTTEIKNCGRLRLKESDRIEAVYNMIKNLGGKIRVEKDSIIIESSALRGGSVDAVNDHRIAMSAAIAAFCTEGAVTVNGAEAVKKSYPSFWDEIR